MSVRVSAKVWPVQLPAVDKIILLKLADSADDEGRNAYPSVRRMMRECGVGERTVQDALKRLRARGLIHETVPADYGAKKPTTYRLDMQAIEAETPAADAGVRTPAGAAPVREVRPTPAAAAPVPPQEPHPEPSLYPSMNRPREIYRSATASMSSGGPIR